MNKRIRELDQQAVDYANNVCDANGIYKGKEYLTVVKEKFAELIVRECADIAKHHVMNISTYADAEFVEEQIAKHFGVEQ